MIPSISTCEGRAAACTPEDTVAFATAEDALESVKPLPDEFCGEESMPQGALRAVVQPGRCATASLSGRFGKARRGNRKSEVGPNLSVTANYLFQSIKSKYGFYADDHPLVVYMKGFASRLKIDKRKVRIYVTKAWDSINACALPNGAIIVSDRLIEFCRYEEELMFVLGHEARHIIQKHTERIFKAYRRLQTKKGDGLEAFLSACGCARAFEYESDIRSILDISRAGANPHGGTVFFTRLAEHDRGKDLEHGSCIDRALNIGMLTRLYDLEALTTTLKDIPAEIKAAVSTPHEKSDYQLLVSESVSGSGRINPERSQCNLEAVSLPVLSEALAKISARISKHEDYLVRCPQSNLTRLRLVEDQRFAGQMIGRMQRLIDVEFAGSSKKTRKEICAVAIMNAGDGIDLMQASGDCSPLAPIADEFADGLEEAQDFQRLAEIFSPSTFERLGLFLKEPKCALESIARLALETDMFNAGGGSFNGRAYFAFCIEWIERVSALAARRGLELFDKRMTFLSLVFLGIQNLRKGEDVWAYLDGSLEQAISIKAEEIEIVAKATGIIGRDGKANAAEEWEEDLTSDEADTVLNAASLFIDAYNDKPREEIELALRRIHHTYGEDAMSFLEIAIAEIVNCEEGRLAQIPFVERLRWANSLAEEFELLHMADHIDYHRIPRRPRELIETYSILKDSLKKAEYPRMHFFHFLMGTLRSWVEKYPKEKFIRTFERLAATIDFSLASGFTGGVFFEAVFSTYEFDLSKPDDLKFLFEISFLLEDVSLAMRFREMIARRLLAILKGDEAFEFLFTASRYRAGTSLKTKEAYIDSEVVSLGDIEKVFDAVVKAASAPPYEKVGAYAIVDVIEGLFRGKKAIFEALMSTGHDDHELRNGVYNADVFVSVELSDARNLTAQDVADAMIRTERTMKSLYSLEEHSRYAVVRWLLVGKDGLLMTKEKRRWLFKYLFKNLVRAEAEGAEMVAILKKGFAELAEEADVETLYFAVAPLIEAKILRPPCRSPDWPKIIRDSLSDEDAIGEAVSLFETGHYHFAPSLQDQDSSRTIGHLLKIERMIGAPPPEQVETRMNPIDLVVEIASRLGSPGVRFLQLLGQFVTIPDEYERGFAKVYDGMRGQTKLTAYLVLKREWPELAEEVREIYAAVGGGSLMTTFRVRTNDGREEVVKVLNPNAEYHLEIAYKILEGVLHGLAKQEGGGYAMASAALGDIRSWIAGDIRFSGFVERDRVFRGQNHGFKPAGFRYSIMVPESRGPESKHFKREEYVDGENLTQRAALEERGHDIREIVALITANFWHQIQTGLVHADIHPGNFRITDDRRVAVLDRNFFIELEDEDRVLMRDLAGAYGNPSEMGKAICAYFKLNPAGREAQEIERTLSQTVSTGQNGLLKKLAISLKTAGIHVPLKITLLIKNINGLASLAHAAGFASLQEVFAHFMNMGFNLGDTTNS